MIHPLTTLKYIDDEIGYGVFATQRIPRGTITWALDHLDRAFTPGEVKQMDPIYQDILSHYTYRDKKGDFVLCWDFGRFVNHSFNSNTFSTAYEFEMAIRDIEAGEELTNDYGYLNLPKSFHAYPEPGSTRTHVYPDDLLRYHAIWDKMLLENFPFITTVEQPLWGLLPASIQEEVHEVIAGRRPMHSIREIYFEEKEKLV